MQKMKFKIRCGWTDPCKTIAKFIVHSINCSFIYNHDECSCSETTFMISKQLFAILMSFDCTIGPSETILFSSFNLATAILIILDVYDLARIWTYVCSHLHKTESSG